MYHLSYTGSGLAQWESWPAKETRCSPKGHSPYYLASDTSHVIRVRDNMQGEKVFWNKARSCHSPSTLQWSSISYGTHSKLLSKAPKLFTLRPLSTFPAFPGLSPTYRQILCSGLSQLHSFQVHHVLRHSYMLFLLPEKPILYLNIHPVDWAKSYEAFQTLVRCDLLQLYIWLPTVAITVVSDMHLHPNMCDPGQRRQFFSPQLFQFPVVIPNPTSGLNVSPFMIFTQRNIYFYRIQPQSICLIEGPDRSEFQYVTAPY